PYLRPRHHFLFRNPSGLRQTHDHIDPRSGHLSHQDRPSHPNPLRLLHHRHQAFHPLLLPPPLSLPHVFRCHPHHRRRRHPLVGGPYAHGFPPLPPFGLLLGSVNPQRLLRRRALDRLYHHVREHRHRSGRPGTAYPLAMGHEHGRAKTHGSRRPLRSRQL
ncbi:MAG: hypothetical protein LQ345_007176, partial [Seirophora villosa]